MVEQGKKQGKKKEDKQMEEGAKGRNIRHEEGEVMEADKEIVTAS